MDQETFITALKAYGIILNDLQLQQFETYAAFLREYNQKINLTTITKIPDIYAKHFYDSLMTFQKGEVEGTLADIGSGAGFPGVVLKIAYPDLEVTLVEPLMKRCRFLNELIAKLDLKKIEVINARGEDYVKDHRETFDYVTARAVSDLNILIEVAGALVKKGGTFIALRGSKGEEDLKKSAKALEQMGFKVIQIRHASLADGSQRVIGDLLKVKKSPLKFPRNYSMIKKNPL